MLTTLVVFLRAVGLICRGSRAVALENLALRQQLAALTRTVQRPPLRTRDRLFWVLLATAWTEWRSTLVLVQPDTVVRWHRQWLRRRWAWRSARRRGGRPRTDAALRTLVSQMAAANPLWGAPRIHGELCKVGVEVSERTVSRLVRRLRRLPAPGRRLRLGEVVSSPFSPWQNPYVERLIGSIRRECLDHVIILGERHVRRILTAYLTYYHGARTHLSLETDAPTTRRVYTPTEGDIIAFPEVGGLHHRYERRAA